MNVNQFTNIEISKKINKFLFILVWIELLNSNSNVPLSIYLNYLMKKFGSADTKIKYYILKYASQFLKIYINFILVIQLQHYNHAYLI